jgi:hypothetical protein
VGRAEEAKIYDKRERVGESIDIVSLLFPPAESKKQRRRRKREILQNTPKV